MTQKPGTRPAHVKAPAHLSKSPPVPTPSTFDSANDPARKAEVDDPTRYGDWTRNGIAVDF